MQRSRTLNGEEESVPSLSDDEEEDSDSVCRWLASNCYCYFRDVAS